jgi:hypothetical protein
MVVINGTVALEDGKVDSEALPGKMLRK